MLVSLSAGHHFLDCWPQQDRVFLKISSVGRLGHSTGYPRIVRSSTPAHRTEVDNLPRSPEPPGDSAVAISVRVCLSPETDFNFHLPLVDIYFPPPDLGTCGRTATIRNFS